MPRPSGNFGAFDLLSLGGGTGATAIVFPQRSFAYFIHQFSCKWTAGAGANGRPQITIDIGGFTITRVSSAYAFLVDSASLHLQFDTRQFGGSSGAATAGVSDVDKALTLMPISLGVHVPLPPQGLYVPLGATCRFSPDGCDVSDAFQDAFALIAESL